MLLTVPADLGFYLRSETKERFIGPDTDLLFLEEGPAEPYAVAQRGAIAHALEQGLFATPLSAAYYSGFITGRPQLMPVPVLAMPFLSELGPRRPMPLGFVAGYMGGPFALATDRFEHGLFARAVFPTTSVFALTLQLESAYAALHGGGTDSAVRLALTPGVELRTALGTLVTVHAGLDAGYGLFSLRGDVGGTDPTVGVARARAGLRLHAVGALSVVLEGAHTGYVISMDGRERYRGQLGLEAGVAVGGQE